MKTPFYLLFLSLATGPVMAQNVGIGTPSPSSRLHVSSPSDLIGLLESSNTFGSVLQLRSTAPGARNWSLVSAGSTFETGNAGHLALAYSSLAAPNTLAPMIIFTGGTGSQGVGIGDHTGFVVPGTLLHIQGQGRIAPSFSVDNQIAISPAAGDQDAGIGLLTTRSGNRAWSIRAGSGAPNSNFRIFDATAGQDRLNITHEGVTGLNNTNPQAILHANLNNSTFNAAIFETNNTSGTMFTLGNTSINGTKWKLLSSGSAYPDGPGNLFFGHANDFSNFTPVFVLRPGYTTATLFNMNPAGTWLNIGNSTGQFWKLISSGSGNGEGPGKLLIGYHTQQQMNSTIVTVTANGLGIDTMHNPIAGVDLPNKAANIGIVRAWGFLDYSSEQWKENIAPIGNALDKVLAMRGVSYTSKSEGPLKETIGFIAEEVGEVMPQLVMWDDKRENALGLFYNRVSALTVNAIQELKAEKDLEIEALRKEKEAEIEALQQRLSALEKQVGEIVAAFSASGIPVNSTFLATPDENSALQQADRTTSLQEAPASGLNMIRSTPSAQPQPSASSLQAPHAVESSPIKVNGGIK